LTANRRMYIHKTSCSLPQNISGLRRKGYESSVRTDSPDCCGRARWLECQTGSLSVGEQRSLLGCEVRYHQEGQRGIRQKKDRDTVPAAGCLSDLRGESTELVEEKVTIPNPVIVRMGKLICQSSSITSNSKLSMSIRVRGGRPMTPK